MLWASIILPITPPELLDATISEGDRCNCCAVTCWRLPKRTFEEVSLPVSATPSQPMSGEKKRDQNARASQHEAHGGVGAGEARGVPQREHERDGEHGGAHAP